MSTRAKILVVAFFLFCSHLAITNAENFKQTLLGDITQGDITNKNMDSSQSLPDNSEGNDNLKKSIYVVGDIMLGRDVERRLLRNGSDFPYKKINFKDEESFAFANFESAIPAIHETTLDNTFRFSVNKNFLADLRSAGFTHLSLANNHTFDFGLAGYNSTISNLWESDFIPFGHPSLFSNSSVSVVNINGIKISFIALHTLFNTPTEENISAVVTYAKSVSDLQVVYIHWGEEYSSVQSLEQRKLARVFAAQGVDIIIGHHPHVVQGIEKIDNTLVFYSLGNYIFDQYFSAPVQNGLMLNLSIEDTIKIQLIPVNSLSVKTQPEVTQSTQKVEILSKLAETSSAELVEQIKQGFIYMDIPLATSSEVAIMAK